MYKVYARGRWAAFLSPSITARYTLAPADGDVEHILSIYHDGNDTLPNPQQCIGWSPTRLWVIVEDYINERDAADKEMR